MDQKLQEAQFGLQDGLDTEQGLRPANLGVSTRIARFLTVAVVLFAITTAGFAYWITREHNRLAGTSSEQMVRGGFATLDEKLQTISMDYAIWPEAVNAIGQHDIPWVWENIGVSAAVTETTDLMLILPQNGEAAYGWIPGMDEDPTGGLLPEPVVERMKAMLDAIPIENRRAVSTLIEIDGVKWLLSTARIVSADTSDDPTDDNQIPRLIFGFILDDERVQELGAQYLISDLSLTETPPLTGPSLALTDETGSPVSFANWTPPRPGDEILRSISVPLAIALGLLTLIALISSRLLVRSAQRVEASMLTAQAASRAKTDFIANISHELRTPMNGIIGLATLLRQSNLEQKQSEMVGMLLSSAETQMGLIGDLLDISSIENGRFNLTIAPFVPATVVRNTAGLFQLEAQQKGLDINLSIVGSEHQVLGDRERFRQVCANLISNALKFTDKGRVDIELSVRERLGEAALQLTVTDTGSGIDPADINRIFQRFAQVSTTEKGKAAGSGLGLAITKTIVDLMGGTISVESSPGKGSTFRVEIALELAESNSEVETSV
jgi:signal transduction histidine kinase